METAAKGRKTAILVLRLAALAAAAGVFTAYAFKNAAGLDAADLAMPLAALICFTFVFIAAAPNIVRAVTGEERPSFAEEEPKGRWGTFALICLCALALHVVTGLAGAFLYRGLGDFISRDADIVSAWRASWMKLNTDAGHYLNIAENWYVKEGNDRLLIVFLPMFPVLIRGLNSIVHDSFISAQIINAAATALASGMTYITLIPAIGEKRSKAAAFIALLLPGAIFMNSPMTEPLFMLFSVCAFFFMQKRRWIAAGIFTAFAGFTRSLGVLLAVPLAFMGLCELIRLIRAKQGVRGTLIRLVTGLVISVLGTLAYLAINYQIHGEALKFFEFQWSNWHQKACPFFDTPRYILDRAIQSVPVNMGTFCSLWLPELIAIFGSLAIMGAAAKRLPAAYVIYFLCYYAVAIGCTWLLSAVRYLCAALPLIAAVALPCSKPRRTAVVFAVLIPLYAAYMLMYMERLGIY